MNKSILIAFLLSSFTVSSVFADVIYIEDLSDYGVVNPLSENTLQSDDDIFLLQEQQNILLENDLLVEQLISSPDHLELEPDSTHDAVISANTRVNSFLFHYDAITSSSTGTSWTRDLSGSFTFDTEIIAVIWSGRLDPEQNQGTEWNLLGLSDFLGGSQLYFPLANPEDRSGIGRGLEPQSALSEDATKDNFLISGDLKTIDVHFKVMPEFADQLRIITASKVPEPTTIFLFASALCLLGFRRFS